MKHAEHQEIVQRIRILEELHMLLPVVLDQPVPRLVHRVQTTLDAPRNEDRGRKAAEHARLPLGVQRPWGDPRTARREVLREISDQRATCVVGGEDVVHDAVASVLRDGGLRADVSLRPVQGW